MPEAGRLNPPAMRARRIALVLSFCAVAFSIAFGFAIRKSWSIRAHEDVALLWLTAALTLLLVALLLRIVAAICELLWLERTWSNLPEKLRKVGPVDNVNSAMLIGFSVVPGLAWVWKLGLVAGIANGFEEVRTSIPFKAPVPKKLGMAAVIVGWVPGLNVYIAPFLWEMFARKIDAVCVEIGVLPG
jgi:hypothetical protein